MGEQFLYDQFGAAIRSIKTATNGDIISGLHIDCEPIIEAAKAERDRVTRKEMFRHAAKVPAHVCEQAMREGWFHDDNAWKKWLNDPANRDFRVWEGRI